MTINAIKPALLVLFLAAPLAAMAQPADQPQAAPNPAANRYREVPGFFKLPADRSMGSSSAVAGDSKAAISGWWTAVAPMTAPAASSIR